MDEKFEYREDCNGYCYRDSSESRGSCYFQQMGDYGNLGIVFVYVTTTGIGIDVDHCCGGNIQNQTYRYDEHDGFVQTYNKVCDEVENLLS